MVNSKIVNAALFDKNFLKQLDEWQEREVYVKLISLDFAENPRTEIQGYATGGSVNVDGASAVRRTCNLTLITQDLRVNEMDWALETKFKLEIGLRNFINPNYDDIIWFPQGVYIITSFSSTANSQGFTISIQGKDKMCLLDGTIGGNIFASHDFGKIELRHADGSIELEPILVYDIIKNAVHEYAFEPYENIIINDLEDCAVELINYSVKDRAAIIYDEKYANGVISTEIAFQGSHLFPNTTVAVESFKNMVQGDHFGDNNQYTLNKFVEYGDTVGYRLTDLTYPTSQDLILAAGASITQMLDSVVKMLGEFEYYYDLEGRFVFQRKKIYYNVSWNNAITRDRETYYDSIENGSENAYVFTKGILIESYNNKPALNNIKNDYTIWGHMIGTSDETLPVHLRCAIDDKPTEYTPLFIREGEVETVFSTVPKKVIVNGEEVDAFHCDWRELIYQMALDYSKSDAKILELTEQIAYETDLTKLEKAKSELEKWSATWNTKYSAYYTDLLDFWRLLYDIDNTDWNTNYHWNPNYVECRRKDKYIEVTAGTGQYIYDEKTGEYVRKDKGTHNNVGFSHYEIHIRNHASIPFWLDFCDDAYLEKYKPANIGRRPKVVNDSEVKAIFFEETPNVLFVDPVNTPPFTDSDLSYTRMNLTGAMANYFTISTQGKSAKETLDSLFYTHTYYTESITLSCIPIYYLEPNVRIAVYDEKSGINGEYIIKSYSLQLTYNGSMSITATKAEDLIL